MLIPGYDPKNNLSPWLYKLISYSAASRGFLFNTGYLSSLLFNVRSYVSNPGQQQYLFLKSYKHGYLSR